MCVCVCVCVCGLRMCVGKVGGKIYKLRQEIGLAAMEYPRKCNAVCYGWVRLGVIEWESLGD